MLSTKKSPVVFRLSYTSASSIMLSAYFLYAITVLVLNGKNGLS